MTKKSKNNKTEFFKYEASKSSEIWLKLVSNNQLYESHLLCLNFIEEHKNYLEKYIQKNEEYEYYYLRNLLVFFKGLQETSSL